MAPFTAGDLTCSPAIISFGALVLTLCVLPRNNTAREMVKPGKVMAHKAAGQISGW